MQPNTPGAPPPFNTQQMPQPNPSYDFITNPGTPQKKSLIPLPGGGSKAMKALLILIVIVIIAVIAMFVSSLLGKADKELQAQLVSAIKQQQELIRISDSALKKARTAEAKNLAITTQLTLTSEQAAMKNAAKTLGVKTDGATLANSDSKKNDEELTKAEQFNKYDEVFIKMIREDLTEYAKTVQTVYKGTENKKAKEALAIQFKTAATLANYKDE